MSPRQHRTIGLLALAAAASTVLWVILMALSAASTKATATVEDKIQLIRADGQLYTAVYLNAALLTLCALLFMSGLYAYCRRKDKLWTAIGVAFVPLYGLANLLCYLSQVFVVPDLLDMHQQQETRQLATTLLALWGRERLTPRS